jgi:TolB-like protein
MSGELATADRLQIADMTLDLRREELRDATGARVDLRNRSFGVLRHLATNAGRIVSKDELLTANWPGVTVTEDSLTQCISEIRRLLGEAGRDLIRTVPRRGYMISLPEQTVRLPGDKSSGPTVAVWRFENNTGEGQRDALADGLTQQIISALGRFGELRVLARGVSETYKSRFDNATDFGRALGVNYIVDGNLRRDGVLYRIDIQLSDARTGAQVWSKIFNANVRDDNLLAIQDEISGQAGAMIGSYWGAIGAAEYKRIQNKPSVELTPYECVVQGVLGIPTDATVLEPVAKARDCLERLTRDEPRNAAAWAALVLVFNNQRTWGFPSPTGEVASVETRLYLADMAVEAANRAIEIAPNDAFVRGLAARAAWMACQPDLLRIETMRAIALNPNDPQNLGPLGNLMAYSGFWGFALGKGNCTDRSQHPALVVVGERKTSLGLRRLYARIRCVPPILCRAALDQPSPYGLYAAVPGSGQGSQDACCHAVEDEARFHHPGSRCLLQDVELRTVVPGKDVRCAADRRTSGHG